MPADGDGRFDYTLNLDNAYLLTELAKAKDTDKDLVVHWFKFGLAIAAMGMVQHGKKLNGSAGTNGTDVLETVNRSTNGLAERDRSDHPLAVPSAGLMSSESLTRAVEEQ